VRRKFHPYLVALLAGLLATSGCKQPTDVELTPDDADGSIEMYPVTMPDQDIVTTSIDSSAVLPAEQVSYDGICVLNSVTWDNGTTVRSLAYSRVLIADSAARFFGRKVGVRGRDIGTLLLNGTAMAKIPHLISVTRLFGRDTSVAFGVEYLTDLTHTYQAKHQYTWSPSWQIFSTSNVNIESPDSLVITAPRGGAVLSRDRKAVIKWTGGSGKLRIYISRYDSTTQRALPVIELKVKASSGKVAIPTSVLALLPADRLFVLTFVLENRKDVTIGSGTATMLVQAASVYNSIVEVR
jgi:hypothetical protein